jgi:hypothetical protein
MALSACEVLFLAVSGALILALERGCLSGQVCRQSYKLMIAFVVTSGLKTRTILINPNDRLSF